MASYPLIGKKTVYIDDLVISPDYVQDEAGSITLTPRHYRGCFAVRHHQRTEWLI